MALVIVQVAASGCLESRTPQDDPGPCTACHGQVSNSEDPLLQSAPPRDLFGNSSTDYPGVGAHQAHLFASKTHAAIACQECHQVPTSTADEGHADSALPAELHFGELASLNEHSPRYSFSKRSCSNTYCHGADQPRWTQPRSSEQACGTCHGLPPPAPHPAADQCATCHAKVVGSKRRIIAPELHVNGSVETDDPGCSECHGNANNAAPPFALDGSEQVNTRAVGAHQAHLVGGKHSRPLACDECHSVPEQTNSAGHLDPSPAEVRFSGIALTEEHTPVWQPNENTCAGSWCHSPNHDQPSALWTRDTGTLGCSGCHGMPPRAPHPQSELCANCHAGVAGSDHQSIRRRERHVDGKVDVDVPQACDACHGQDGESAPPPDLFGRTDPSQRGVGAHRAHLTGSGRARALACEECHDVPSETLSSGHVDTPLPAEVLFGDGPARAFLATPEYDRGTCSQTFCHGDAFIGGRPSGGIHTVPEWTESGRVAANCNSCHGMPPPAPHPTDTEDCARCHQNAGANNTWIHPELHVDGIVTFFVR